MSKEETIVSSSKISYKGIFDLQELYNLMRGNLMMAGWDDPVEKGEEKYSEKVKPNGKMIEIVWKTSKEEEKGYFKLQMTIKFFIMGLNEVETEKDGKKLKLDKGDIAIEVSSKIMENAKNAWEEHSLMFKIYEKYFIKERIEEVKIQLYQETNKLVDTTKTFLNLYRLD
jgi:hypothetical protein